MNRAAPTPPDDRPPRPPAPAYASPSDEISLRDLYLVLRRALPWILLGALAFGAAAFLAVSLRPAVFEASATAVVDAAPIQAAGGALSFDPRAELPLETYRALAFGRDVIEATTERAGVGDVGTFAGRAEIERLAGPQRDDQAGALTVAHVVRDGDPEVAAALANAWTAATLEAARANFVASLEPVRAGTESETAERGARLDEAAAAWEAFRERDDAELAQARLDAAVRRIAGAETSAADLRTRIAGLEEEVRLLVERGAGEGAGLGREEALDLLATRPPTEEAEASEVRGPDGLAARLAGLPDAPDGAVALLESARLSEALSTLVRLRGERAALEAGIEADRAAAAELRARLADLERERSLLEGDLERARTAYGSVAELEPLIGYLGALAPATSRVLTPAAAPTAPTGSSPLLIAVAAAVAGAGLMALLALLRAAVAAPPPRAP